MDNFVITIARQYGSGGRTVGEMLAKKLGIGYYDKDIIRMASEDSGIHETLFGRVDEYSSAKKPLFGKNGIYSGELISPQSKDFTSDENLIMGAYTRKDKAEIQESLAGVYKRFPRLEERKGQRAGTLSGGEQQMLAMGRALMSKPRLIVMDEPSMGLSPIFVNEIFDIIRVVSESGTTVLLVEQNAKKALSIADRAYVLETGKITMSGNASDLLNDEAVQKAYLGE